MAELTGSPDTFSGRDTRQSLQHGISSTIDAANSIVHDIGAELVHVPVQSVPLAASIVESDQEKEGHELKYEDGLIDKDRLNSIVGEIPSIGMEALKSSKYIQEDGVKRSGNVLTGELCWE